MYTPLLIGLLFSLSLAAAGVALFFVRAWMRRRVDREYLYFGLLGAAAAVHFALFSCGYLAAAGHPLIPLTLVAVMATVPSKVGLVLMVHFALRYARVRRERAIMMPLYVLTLAFVVLGLSGRHWIGPAVVREGLVAGLSVHLIHLQPTRAAGLFYLLVPVATVTTVALLGRVWLKDHRGGLAAFAGSLVLAGALFNDVAAVRYGAYPSVPLLPMAFFVFSFGVSLTLVRRYGQMSQELTLRNDELQERSAELDASYRDLQRAHEQLVRSEQLAVVGELAAVIAHEVRNPLAIVNNAVASLRKRHTTADDRRTLLEIINEEMGRLDKLVSRLLNYARPAAAKHERINLRELIMRTLALIEDRPGVTAELSFEGGVGEVSCDPDLLRQAFENVVTNAVQAMRDEGTLRVAVSRHIIGGVPSIAIDFHDDGEGMSEVACEQALSPFFTTRPTGTGLGLPIVGRVIEAHGGALSIRSTPGVGTTVRIALPEQPGKRLLAPAAGRARISLLS